MERVDFELDDGMRIAADVFGPADGSVVVLLHGGGQTRHAWGGTGTALAARGLRAICIDQRGHGDSAWDTGARYEMADFAGDLLGVLEQLGRPVVLVGASLGGIVSLAVAAAHPGRCLGLVLVDVTPRLRRAGVERIVGFMGADPQGFRSLEEAADAVAAYLPHRPRPPSIEGLRKNLRRGPDGRYRWHWDPALLDVWRPDHSDDREEEVVAARLASARALVVPTLLVRGRMSSIVSEAHAAEFLEAVPHAGYVDLADAAHMVAGDRNDAFTGAVLAFLERLSSATAT